MSSELIPLIHFRNIRNILSDQFWIQFIQYTNTVSFPSKFELIWSIQGERGTSIFALVFSKICFTKLKKNSIKRRLKQNAVCSLQTQGAEPEIWRLTFKTENTNGKYNIQISHRVIQLSSVSPWRKKDIKGVHSYQGVLVLWINIKKWIKMQNIKSNKKSWQLILTPSVKHLSPCQGRSETFYWIHWVVLSFQAPVCVCFFGMWFVQHWKATGIRFQTLARIMH